MSGNKKLFVVGALFGGLLGLVLAPKSGKDLRGELESRSEKLKDKTIDLAAEVKERGKEFTQDLSLKSKELIRKVKGVRCCEECCCECESDCCQDCCCDCCDECECRETRAEETKHLHSDVE